jgi:hypothetical protein
VPLYPLRQYKFDGSDYSRQTVDIMKFKVGSVQFDFATLFPDKYQTLGISKLSLGDSQGYIGVP